MSESNWSFHLRSAIVTLEDNSLALEFGIEGLAREGELIKPTSGRRTGTLALVPLNVDAGVVENDAVRECFDSIVRQSDNVLQRLLTASYEMGAECQRIATDLGIDMPALTSAESSGFTGVQASRVIEWESDE